MQPEHLGVGPPANSQPVRRTLVLIALIALMEPISATMLLPFVYFMVKDFDPTDIQHIGLRAGLITSAFFVPQMITTIPYGFASDRYGRKPMLITGLAGSALFLALFGLSKSMSWAIVVRALCGLCNGNTPITRTAAGELADQFELNQGSVFAIFGVTQALGYVVGPMIGGYLARPSEVYKWDGPSGIFAAYPYLLPCLIGTLLILTVAIISTFLLEETNQSAHPRWKGKPQEVEVPETQPLLEPTANLRKSQAILTRSMTAFTVSILFMCLHAIAFDEGLPVFLAFPTRPQGLGFTSSQIATTLSAMGPVLLLAQFVGYPMLSSRFGPSTIWRWSAATYILIYPMISALPHLMGRLVTWSALLVLLAGRFVANVAAYTSMAVMLNQMAPPGKKGATMGIAQTGMSLGRAVGPAIGGTVWSWGLASGLPFPFGSHALFMFLASLAGLQGISTLWV